MERLEGWKHGHGVWLALALCTVGLGACGGQPPCGPDTCATCCLDGVCYAGTTADRCGYGGMSCVVCPDAQACVDSRCVEPPVGAGGGGVAATGGGGGAATGGGGGAACTDTCSPVGSTRCAGAGVESCERASSGCLAWSAPLACPGGATCSASTQACPDDPCHGVPTSGVCTGAQSYQICASSTGQGSPTVFTVTCPQGSTCGTSTGQAACQNSGTCTPGTSWCSDASHVVECNGGTPVTAACAHACLDTALGAMCTGADPTTPISLTVQYVARGPNSSYTDWDTSTFNAPAAGLLALSMRDSTPLDAQVVDAQGQVTLRVGTAVQAGDTIVLVAAALDGTGSTAFMVGDPGFTSPGTYATNTVGSPSVWNWSIDTSAVGSGGTVTIREANGSGAARVFDYLRYVYDYARRAEGGRPGKPLVVWLGYGTSWDCGACFAAVPTTFSSFNFGAQLWLAGSTTDQAWWADAVTAHELGHWVMSSYGRSPGEGGRHVIGGHVYPGMAWSEGWATWLSSDVRNDSIYADKQNGTMFWLDLASRSYSGSTPWTPPTPSSGLLQLIDENEVAAMLWSLSSSPLGDQPLFDALASAHMTNAPWARGYTRHRWTQLDSHGNPLNAVDTGVPAPCVADLFDALVCGGASPATLDAATQPATQYPYPSNAPLCH